MERKLSPELKKFFEERVFRDGVPEPFKTKENPTAALLLTALSCKGIVEYGGNNHGKAVELFQGTVGDVDYSSWCLSFLQSCVAFVENHFEIKSQLPATEHCLTLWNTAPKDLREKVAKPGRILVWRKDGSILGHVGLVISETKAGYYRTVEGNTNDEDGFVREGQGVYLRTRAKSGIDGFTTKGFLRVFEQFS